MKVIIGLGNPGSEYKGTRHNFGFMILNELAQGLGCDFRFEPKFEAEIAEYELKKEKILLVKPQTFMNNSGQAIKKIVDFYKVPFENLLLVYDDVDLPLGQIRQTGLSSGGHKGAESIFSSLGTKDLPRIRLGIENQKTIPTDTYVLQKFTSGEKQIIKESSRRITETIIEKISS